jgi:hypothetical protein
MLYRPDGVRLVGPPPEARMAVRTQRALPAAGPLPAEDAQAWPDGGHPRALPGEAERMMLAPGDAESGADVAQLPARIYDVQRVRHTEDAAGVPVPAAGPLVPVGQGGAPAVSEPPPAAPPRQKKKKPNREKAPETPPGPVGPVPEVQFDCPSCAHPVYEKDSYCENCGRDLTLRPGRREHLGPARPYATADWALLLGTLSALAIFLPPPWAYALPVFAGAVSTWALTRIGMSRGALTGQSKAAGGLIASVLWLLIAYAVR